MREKSCIFFVYSSISLKEKTMAKISKLGLAGSALLASASGLSIVSSSLVTAHASESQAQSNVPTKEGTYSKKVALIDENGKQVGTTTLTIKVGAFNLVQPTLSNDIPEGYGILKTNNLEAYPDSIKVAKKLPAGTTTKKIKVVDKKTGAQKEDTLTRTVDKLGNYAITIGDSKNFRPDGYSVVDMNELKSFPDQVTVEFNISLSTLGDGLPDQFTTVHIDNFYNPVLDRNNYVRTYSKQVKLVDEQGKSLGTANLIKQFTDLSKYPYQEAHDPKIVLNEPGKVALDNMPKGYGFEREQANELETWDTNLPDQIVLSQITANDKDKPLTSIDISDDRGRTVQRKQVKLVDKQGKFLGYAYRVLASYNSAHGINATPYVGGISTPVRYSKVSFVGIPKGYQVDLSSNDEGDTVVLVKSAGADKTDNDRDKSGTATNTGTNTDKGQQANDPSKDSSKTVTDGKTTTDQGKTSDGTITNTADKGQQSGDASHIGNITNASDNKQIVTTDPSANAGNTDAKTATDTKKDSTTSNSSAKSNSTASSATDKAKSNASVANGQSNADKAKTAETANRAVTGKTAKTASTAKTAPKADTANATSESGKATIAKTNKQVVTGNTKKSTNKSTSSSQKAGNTTSANAGTTVKSSNADNDSNSKETLPQTGNSSSTAGILAGTALIATMATLGITHKKRV